MLPFLLLGGLAILILSSRPSSQPSSSASVGNLIDAHLILAMERLADAADERAGKSLARRRPDHGAIVPNEAQPGQFAGFIHGAPIHHTGFSCSMTGRPVVVDRWGRPFLLTS